jgi:hypothetical protein
VLAGYAGSLHWDKAAVWCYLLFLVSLLAVGVAGQISVTRSSDAKSSTLA